MLSSLAGMSKSLSFLGPVGAGIGLAGEIIGAISSIFSAAAKHIAENLQKDFTNIMEAYKAGNTTIIQTEAALAKERADAISRLSGVKGGDKELAKILDEIDKASQQLQQQAQNIQQSFNDRLSQLRVGATDKLGEEGAKNMAYWMEIFKVGKEALGAGESPAKC